MRPVAHLLRDGLRLAFGLRPRHTPLDAGFGSWLVLALLGAAVAAAWQWPMVDAPRMFNGYGVQTMLAAALLHLAACAALAAAAARRAIFWAVAGWLEAALLPVGMVAGALQWWAQRESDTALYFAVWAGSLAWMLLVLLRLAALLAPRARARVLGGATLAFALLVAPWFWLEAQRLWQTDWEATAGEDAEWREPGLIDDAERTFYAQPERLEAALAALAPQRPGTVDLYAVAFGGDASEDVFRNEVEYFERLFAQRFDARGRTLALLNHPASAAARPLASATNLERALAGIGARMDPAEDILFLYLTSHGSEEHELRVHQPPLPLDPLTPERLRAALDASGIRWRVLVVSACYSGGYVEALRDAQTLVLTAAHSERTSFGCGSDSEITWFGKAFLAAGLNRTDDFVAAFEHARTLIRGWERKEKIVPSKPQIAEGVQIAAQLQRWRAGFRTGPELPFAPAGSQDEPDPGAAAAAKSAAAPDDAAR